MPQRHVEPTLKELNELSERIINLTLFICPGDTPYKELSKADRTLLRAQLSAMIAYQKILEIRLDLENTGMEHTQ